MDTTLGEQILLLSLDDATGASRLPLQTEFAISAAALAELALARRLDLADGKVVVTDPAPTGVPAVDDVLARIAAEPEPADVPAWMYRIQQPALDAARRGLVDKGLVREEHSRRWGLFPRTRYPAVDGSVEAGVRDRLAAVLAGAKPDDRTRSLVVLLHTRGLHDLVLPRGTDRAARERRMAQLSEGDWSQKGAQQVLDALLIAVVTGSMSGVATNPG